MSTTPNDSSTTLRVKEAFATLQGEGSLTGTPAVFLRLSGCNAWNGIESGRGRGAGDCAAWCDTSFAGGTALAVTDVAQVLLDLLRDYRAPFVVVTGGEPLLQARALATLMRLPALSEVRFALETNGTVQLGPTQGLWTHVTCSPKVLVGRPLALDACDDLKLVVPSAALDSVYQIRATIRHRNLYFQPRDDSATGDGKNWLQDAMTLARLHGGRVSIQTHKFAGLP